MPINYWVGRFRQGILGRQPRHVWSCKKKESTRRSNWNISVVLFSGEVLLFHCFPNRSCEGFWELQGRPNFWVNDLHFFLFLGEGGGRGWNGLACENIRFSSPSPLGPFRAEERLRLRGRNSILMTQINVYIINLVVMVFQIQICSKLLVFWSILVKCCVHLPTSYSKTQILLLEKTTFHKYWLFC